jgi:hypothetical protein
MMNWLGNVRSDHDSDGLEKVVCVGFRDNRFFIQNNRARRNSVKISVGYRESQRNVCTSARGLDKRCILPCRGISPNSGNHEGSTDNCKELTADTSPRAEPSGLTIVRLSTRKIPAESELFDPIQASFS